MVSSLCVMFCSSDKSLVLSPIFPPIPTPIRVAGESLLPLALMSWAILMDSSRDTA